VEGMQSIVIFDGWRGWSIDNRLPRNWNGGGVSGRYQSWGSI